MLQILSLFRRLGFRNVLLLSQQCMTMLCFMHLMCCMLHQASRTAENTYHNVDIVHVPAMLAAEDMGSSFPLWWVHTCLRKAWVVNSPTSLLWHHSQQNRRRCSRLLCAHATLLRMIAVKACVFNELEAHHSSSCQVDSLDTKKPSLLPNVRVPSHMMHPGATTASLRQSAISFKRKACTLCFWRIVLLF